MLIEAALQFPTVVFTIGLGIILLYWVFVLVGALDIDLFGDASGAGKGLGDVIGHAGHGADAHHVGDGHHHAETGSGGVWSGLGLSKVPMTISVSVIVLVCWCFSLLGMHYGPAIVGNGTWVPGLILVASLVIGLPLAGLLVRPLAGVFELREGKSNRDYVGHTCTITTGNVNDTFGQATVEDGGTVLQIPVRCDRSDVLARGHKALIIEFDSTREAYVVEPVTDMLAASRATDAT